MKEETKKKKKRAREGSPQPVAARALVDAAVPAGSPPPFPAVFRYSPRYSRLPFSSPPYPVVGSPAPWSVFLPRGIPVFPPVDSAIPWAIPRPWNRGRTLSAIPIPGIWRLLLPVFPWNGGVPVEWRCSSPPVEYRVLPDGRKRRSAVWVLLLLSFPAASDEYLPRWSEPLERFIWLFAPGL